MLELLADPNVWVAFATLTIMEIVLGIDNIVFISVLVSRLPREQAEFARKLGIGLALVFRIILLFLISWIVQLQDPVFTAFEHAFSWKDIILIAGGGFLIYKATHEMHAAIEDDHEVGLKDAAGATLQAILLQIVVIDAVFSIDSIITAVGMVPADQVFVMVAAVLVAVLCFGPDRQIRCRPSHHQDAGAGLPAADRRDAGGRWSRLPYPQGLYLLGHGLLGAGRGGQYLCQAAQAQERRQGFRQAWLHTLHR